MVNAQAFDCKTCANRHCDADSPAPFPLWNINGVDFTVCPKGLVKDDEWITEAFTWYGHYKGRLLPHSGGLLDQSQEYLTMMSLIDGCLNAVKSELQRR